MFIKEINNLLKEEPAFRIKQVERSILGNFIDNWDLVTELPVNLRQLLKKNVSLNINAKLIFSSNSSSLKALIELDDGIKIETVLLRHKDGRNTVCVSSQAGCAMSCTFCKTGKIGFSRNLSYEEIIIQAIFFARYLKEFNSKLTNIVFMGMGEPLLNYENVIQSIRIFNDKNKFNIGQRKISVSTSGIVDKIIKLADEQMQINLAVSINAPNDGIRKLIMPVANLFSIEDILDSIKYYIKKTNRRVMLEYILLNGINDEPEHAEELSKKIKDLLCFVNLIPYNGSEDFKRPSLQKINEFKRILLKNKIHYTQRYEFGSDITAACGQLVFSKV